MTEQTVTLTCPCGETLRLIGTPQVVKNLMYSVGPWWRERHVRCSRKEERSEEATARALAG